MKRPITFAVLGDSAATGVGDYDELGRPRGWCYYLAGAFPEPVNIINVARAGAQSTEVHEEQLPRALAYKPDLVALVVGGNDLLRNGFSPIKLYENLRNTILEFKVRDTNVLMLQLHDPTEIVPMPRLLARVLRRRVNAVNRVYEKLVSEFELVFLRTRLLPNLYEEELWHFDRMHPSSKGHYRLAENFRLLLQTHGWQMSNLEKLQLKQADRKAKLLWMAKHGTPWFLKRSFDLFPAALVLMAIELARLTYNGFKQILNEAKFKGEPGTNN